MEFSAQMIASFLDGEVAGDPQATVWTISKIEEAQAGSLAFLSNPKYERYLYTTQASVVIVDKTLVPSAGVSATLVKVDDAYSAFARLLELYVANKPQKKGISSMAFISETASLGEDNYVGEYAYIGENVRTGDGVKIYPQVYIGDNVVIGNHAVIYPGVKIYENCVIGDHVILHGGCVIGADGFGFAPVEGEYKKIPQIGNVVLEDYVEIGANTCIDRATMGSTVIKKGVKLDNLIQVGHNVVIGENTVAAAQAGIAGSTKIGKNCMFGGQVGIAGHISIADRTVLASQSGIGTSVKKEGQVMMGAPAFNARDFQRANVVFKQLPELRAQVLALQKEVAELKKEREE